MKRKPVLLCGGLILAIVLCMIIFRRPLAIAYHTWRMDAAFNTIFGDPHPLPGTNLAGFNVEGIDVDAVLETYASHRQKLVDLGVFSHLTAQFPHLASDHSASDAFVNRMWVLFPKHRHYVLAPDGQFETWVLLSDKSQWKRFLANESARQARPQSTTTR